MPGFGCCRISTVSTAGPRLHAGAAAEPQPAQSSAGGEGRDRHSGSFSPKHLDIRNLPLLLPFLPSLPPPQPPFLLQRPSQWPCFPKRPAEQDRPGSWEAEPWLAPGGIQEDRGPLSVSRLLSAGFPRSLAEGLPWPGGAPSVRSPRREGARRPPAGEPGHLHGVAPPFQGQGDSPLGPVASDLGDKPRPAERRLLPDSCAKGAARPPRPARASGVPFSSLLPVEGRNKPALAKGRSSTVPRVALFLPSQGLQSSFSPELSSLLAGPLGSPQNCSHLDGEQTPSGATSALPPFPTFRHKLPRRPSATRSLAHFGLALAPPEFDLPRSRSRRLSDLVFGAPQLSPT